MFPRAEDELVNIRSTLQSTARKYHQEGGDQGPEMEVQLIPWEYHRVQSRCGLLNLWNGYQQQILANDYLSSVYFLLEPAKNNENVLIGTLYYDMSRPAIISWVSVFYITSKLTKEQDQAIRAELHTMSEIPQNNGT